MLKLARMLGGVILLAGLASEALGQTPVIASFNRNGELVCTNLEPGTVASVEWASSVLGPWTNNWAGRDAATADSNGTIRVSVPMFYRVRGVGWTNPAVPPFSPPSNMVWIAPGTFTMGSPDSEPARQAYEGPQTQVTISRGFYMGKCEVTQGEYEALTSNNPSRYQGDLSRPVERVSWNDAVGYCAALTTRERSAGRLPTGYVYRLPTEAEWEYACRAGTTTPFSFGSELRSGSPYANFDGFREYPPCGDSTLDCRNWSGARPELPMAVGSYLANAWGLHDMHGNVWEWCQDWRSEFLPGGSVTDPQGPGTGSVRVVRGGGWLFAAHNCRSACRTRALKPDMFGDQGFRVVLAPGQP